MTSLPSAAADCLAAPRLIPGSDRLPVLLSVPHSGRCYPDWLVRLSRRGREPLRVLEDPLVDRLIWRAQALGISAVVAEAPRAAIDCNRAEDEVDPHCISLAPGSGHDGWRVRAGLGLVPSRTPQTGDLWRRKIGPAELHARIESAWRPYHHLLGAELERLQRRHGEVLLLDCHSMPWRAGQAELVIGDRHGESAAPFLSDLARQVAGEAGFKVALNDPYAGGHIVACHGAPKQGVHALQLELDRRCYLDSSGFSPGPGFDRSARLLEALAARLGAALAERGALPLAAE
jgi:N-formylglutamate amidohydrolase